MLFADFFDAPTFLFLIFIFVVGTRQICKTLKGNDAVRGAAKKGAFNLLGRIFKK